MNKASQISMFAILALALLVFAGFVFVLGNTQSSGSGDLQPADIRQYVGSCLKSTLEQGVFFVGAQGGYNEPSRESFSFGSISLPYYYALGRSSFPSLGTIEQEMGRYIEQELPACIAGFSPFTVAGYEVAEGSIDAQVVIGARDISVSLDYPLTIARGEDVYSTAAFSQVLPFNFRSKYEVVQDILAKQDEQPNYAPIGHLALSAYENGYFFETTDFPDSTVVYALVFNETPQFGEMFVYAYAVKYDWDGGTEEKVVAIEPILGQEAYVGYPFAYDVQATGNDIRFSLIAPSFADIEPRSGLISFTPTHEQGGTSAVVVLAEDPAGNSDVTMFKLEVKGYSRPPLIEPIPDFILAAGGVFTYTARAHDEDNETVLFTDNSTMFDINPLEGVISFTPAAGVHHITIIATDTRGLSDEEAFTVAVS